MPRVFLVVCLVFLSLRAAVAENLIFSNQQCQVTIDSTSLKTKWGALEISAAQSDLGPVEIVERKPDSARWIFPDHKLQVSVRLQEGKFTVNFSADEPGSFSWPVMPADPAVKAWILPMAEGVYVPSDDAAWINHLTNSGGLNTTADFGLPFWGWDCGEYTLSFILTNQFNNELLFSATNGRLQMTATHEFTRNNPVKQFGYVIQAGGKSPVTPAKNYRTWLQERGEFVSLKEKIKAIPATAKLLGAAHIYLWGEEIIAADDVKDWKGFALALKEKTTIWAELKPETQKMVAQIISAEWPDHYMKSVVLEDLNSFLSKPNLEQKFIADFSAMLAPRTNWGNGVSPKMVRQLANAGFDRLWLGAGSWDGFVRDPETVKLAESKGYLIGPYDSYHSIHRPGESDTWETAQFDQQLYDTGGIIQSNGKMKNGFKQKGHILSPRAVRPYLEKRVGDLMKVFPANSWFMDCDGFGEFFDDYSTVHPATQQSDAAERVSRMKWIGTNYGAVVGSEGCSAVIAPSIAFAHGVLTPVIGWGDKDLNDKKSKYYLGAYYPANGPAVFLKSVPIKEEYRRLYYDPRFRLPLFETVFHDSVVATHHWSTPSWKFTETIPTTELLELLYDVPPLYHLNVEEFQKRKKQMQTHYAFFSPLHRLAGLLPMTDFAWLSVDRMRQRTVFGDELEMIADFSKNTIQAKWLKTGEIKTFAPKTP